MIFGLEFPPIENLVEWPGFFNKVALIYLIGRQLYGPNVGLLAAAFLAVTSWATAAPLNTNLVLNGDFENVNLQSTGEYNGPQILGWQGMSAFAYSHDGSSSSGGVVPNYADGAPPPGAGHWYFTSNNAGATTDINAPTSVITSPLAGSKSSTGSITAASRPCSRRRCCT